MKKDARSGTDIIRDMSRDDFHNKFVRGIGQTRSFGALASFFAANIDEDEKEEVRKALSNIGIPRELTETDEALDEIAAVVSARAVTLK